MMSSRRIAALAAALSLALPAGALAQGAGDNQYQDPFAGEDSGSGSGSGSGGGGGGGGGAEGTNGNGSLSDSPPSGEQLASQSTSSGELPRTGADPGLVALLGAGLMLTGAGLRVRVRRPIA
jgi:LPXTG-motif cell wall-anchored protein